MASKYEAQKIANPLGPGNKMRKSSIVIICNH